MKKVLLLLVVALASAVPSLGQTSNELWRHVEIIRTAHGVPHIRAKNLHAAGYGLAWVQCEDYGTRTPLAILSASGRRASVEGREHLESDFFTLQHRVRVMKSYNSLSKDVRDVYEGFAAGVNRYIELHRGDFPAAMPADLTAQDVAASEIIPVPARKVRNFLNRLNAVTGDTENGRRGDAEASWRHRSEPGAVATGPLDLGLRIWDCAFSLWCSPAENPKSEIV